MPKLINLLLFIMVVDFMLIIFLGATFPGSSLIELVQNPENWSNLSLKSFMTDMFAVAGLVGIVIGSIWTKSDFLIFAGVSAIFFSFGFSLVQLYQEMVGAGLGGNTYIAQIIVGALILIHIYAVLSFWRAHD